MYNKPFTTASNQQLYCFPFSVCCMSSISHQQMQPLLRSNSAYTFHQCPKEGIRHVPNNNTKGITTLVS
ncbi:hypothetical protein KAM334_40750 [Aeromonas caviae]|nr:hypothetical protein KAM334_40750 [Aeromonas caviae]